MLSPYKDNLQRRSTALPLDYPCDLFGVGNPRGNHCTIITEDVIPGRHPLGPTATRRGILNNILIKYQEDIPMAHFGAWCVG